MEKISNKYIFLFLFCICISCSKDYEDKKELVDYLEKEEYILTENEAENFLLHFIEREIQTKSQEKIEIGSYKLHYYEVLDRNENKSNNIPVYEYLIKKEDQEGYALILGDRRIQKILAFVENGSPNDTAFIEPLKLFFNSIPSFIKNEFEMYYEEGTEILITTKNSVSSHECFVPTLWGQQYPYNAACPLSTCSPAKYNGRFPAGCVAISIAQIMARWNFNHTLDWSAILRNPEITGNSSSAVINQVSNLIATIGEKVYMGYGCSSSGAYDRYVVDAFQYYNYYHESLQSYSLEKIIQSLNYDRPVYMSGQGTHGGHAWVCDGWKSYTNNYINYDYYLHMNWGWNGISNGYFYADPNSPEFEAYGMSFYYSMNIIPNIRPW